MHEPQFNRDRRRLAIALALGALSPALPVGAAGGSGSLLTATPAQSRGPFYPDELPDDRDADLVRVAGRPGPARGTVTHLQGRVVDTRGRPVRDALVEIWQCDANGRYHHPGDRRDVPRDENFQGYGSTPVSGEGGYRFRTIRPVSYPGRAPHVHFAIHGVELRPLVTQMYVAGESANDRDFLLGRLPPRLRRELVVPLEPRPGAAGELIGRFDIILAADGRFGAIGG